MDPHAHAHGHFGNVAGRIIPHRAHHISEFGEVENLEHIDAPIRPSIEDELPAPPRDRKDPLALHERISRLRRKCFHERHIHQYWQGETLYRTEGSRKIGPDELFLDLVIVGAIAAFGHELREYFDGWPSVEKFILLFAAIYSSWRGVVFLWNLWGVASDLIDKIGIYSVFTCLTFIALGAHGAFDDGPRPYVAAAAFLALVSPLITSVYWGMTEPLLRPSKGLSQTSIYGAVNFCAALPYFAAAFVKSEQVTRILYWVGLVSNLITLFVTSLAYRFFVRDYGKTARYAISIELLVEKYEVLTMIVLGESVLGILFEGSAVVTTEGVKLGSLFGSSAAATAMLYALQTLYTNVDAPIAKGGKHAVRHRKLNGILWSQLHVPYHAALVIFATGLGLAVRDIAMPYPSETAAEHALVAARTVTAIASGVHAEGAGVDGKFGTKERWLFATGWGASLIFSGLIGSLHLAGPRAATKQWRFMIRTAIVLPLTLGMPYSTMKAEYFLAVFAAVLIVIALVEFVFVQMDKMGFFRSETTVFSSSADASNNDVVQFGDERDDDDGDDSADVVDLEKSCLDDYVNNQVQDAEKRNALRARLCKSHKMTLVPVSQRKCQQEKLGEAAVV